MNTKSDMTSHGEMHKIERRIDGNVKVCFILFYFYQATIPCHIYDSGPYKQPKKI